MAANLSRSLRSRLGQQIRASLPDFGELYTCRDSDAGLVFELRPVEQISAAMEKKKKLQRGGCYALLQAIKAGT